MKTHQGEIVRWREVGLRALLYLASLCLFVWWGLTHIVFKVWYFDLFDMSFRAHDHFDNVASEMIGVMAIALAYGAFVAAKNPAQSLVLLKTLILTALGASAVFVVNMILGRVPMNHLLSVAFILSVVVGVLLLWPRKRRSSSSSSVAT